MLNMGCTDVQDLRHILLLQQSSSKRPVLAEHCKVSAQKVVNHAHTRNHVNVDTHKAFVCKNAQPNNSALLLMHLV